MRAVRTKPNRYTQYTDAYKESVFQAWYAAGRPRGQKSLRHMPKTDAGDYPLWSTITTWIRKEKWHERADRLDQEALSIVESQAVDERVEMLRQHADLGRKLRTKAMEYVDQAEFDDLRTAIAAIRLGVQIEATSRGVPSSIFQVQDMSDLQLMKSIGNLLDKVPQEDLEEISQAIEANYRDVANHEAES